MSRIFHHIDVLDKTIPAREDRLMVGYQADVASAAGGAAGAAVTTHVSFDGLPAKYAVDVTPSQACFTSVTNKTSTGFDVVLTPTSGTATLAAGTFDVKVTA